MSSSVLPDESVGSGITPDAGCGIESLSKLGGAHRRIELIHLLLPFPFFRLRWVDARLRRYLVQRLFYLQQIFDDVGAIEAFDETVCLGVTKRKRAILDGKW